MHEIIVTLLVFAFIIFFIYYGILAIKIKTEETLDKATKYLKKVSEDAKRERLKREAREKEEKKKSEQKFKYNKSLFEDTYTKPYEPPQEIMDEYEADVKRSRGDYREYQEYINNSLKWKFKRKQRLELDNYTCQECGTKLHISTAHVHHKNYDSLYNEKMEHLESLCRHCHIEIRHGGKESSS